MLHHSKIKFSFIMLLLLLITGKPAFGVISMKNYQSGIDAYYAVKGSDAQSIDKRFECLAGIIPHLKDLNDSAAKDLIPVLEDLSKRINEYYKSQDSFGYQVCCGFMLMEWNDLQPQFTAGYKAPAIWIGAGYPVFDSNGSPVFLLKKQLPSLVNEWTRVTLGRKAGKSQKDLFIEVIGRTAEYQNLAKAFNNIRKAKKQRQQPFLNSPYYIKIENTDGNIGYYIFSGDTPYQLLLIPANIFSGIKTNELKPLPVPSSIRYDPPKPPHFDYYYYDDDDDTLEAGDYNYTINPVKQDKDKNNKNTINVEFCHPDDLSCDVWRTYSIKCHCFTNGQ
jgi:hypothetical protein